MCRRVAHRASSTAATVTGGVADTSLRVADGIVSRMGGSNYGQSVLLCYSVCCYRQSESCLRARTCHTNLCWQKKNRFLSFCEHSFPADFCSMFTVFHAAACLHLSCVEHLQLTSQFGLSSSGSKCVCMCLCRKLQGSKSTRRNAAREISAASVVAAAGIYNSMNVAANTVLQSGGQTTSSFIGHKYVPCLQHCGQFFTGSLCSILDHVLC